MREFWSMPSSWPMDPAGYVFLARAMDELGRARYGRDWTGEEFSGGMNDAGNALTSSSGMGETISRKDRNPEETSCTAQAP